MTTIKLNNYYPHLTECITMEVSEEIAVVLSTGAASATATSGASGSITSALWTLTPALSRM